MYIDEDCDCDFCREAKKAYNKTDGTDKKYVSLTTTPSVG